jgi:hypothetical protein
MHDDFLYVLFWIKLVSFMSILWRRRAHNSTYIMGVGDSHGANDVVNDNAGAETFDDDLVAMYLGYYDV